MQKSVFNFSGVTASFAVCSVLILLGCHSETPTPSTTKATQTTKSADKPTDETRPTESTAVESTPVIDESVSTNASVPNTQVAQQATTLPSTIASGENADTAEPIAQSADTPDGLGETSAAAEPSATEQQATADEPKKPVRKPKPLEVPSGMVALNPRATVLLDKPGKRVLLRTKVCMTEGMLEMLACQDGTKTHESILAIDAKSYVVHAGLLALGAQTGSPVSFTPEFTPPTGEEIQVFVSWKDKQGKDQRRNVNEWVRHSIYRYFEIPMEKLPKGFELPEERDLRYDDLNKYLLWFGPMEDSKRDELLKLSDDKAYQAAIRKFHKMGQSRPMKAKFIFAGSSFYFDEETNERSYRGEGGYLICVANFPAATIDIAVESSADGDGQMYEAWTERIPPIGTDVTIELIPTGVVTKRPIPAAVNPKQETDASNAEDSASTGDSSSTDEEEAAPQ